MKGAKVQNEQRMDVTGSLRKIAKELAELRYDSDNLEEYLEGASWLITYIADCLDQELRFAAERGRKLAMKQLGVLSEDNPPTHVSVNPDGVRIYGVLSGDDI